MNLKVKPSCTSAATDVTGKRFFAGGNVKLAGTDYRAHACRVFTGSGRCPLERQLGAWCPLQPS
ncbi:hypothetical protein PAXRUDRAFT_823866 [Paxillus rubicundulus Ve08.2h10]|uniref:Uncharacterized protein n=1 Tax=Paxillus rubicundulus Ve08.2h10 TaxID=930991 RepID=A0A0D0DJC0_9AGAM|nr:hypothetical protein PAXRUDRAFT_823866 [Paxillus rubicundulus Ve08.2h10]